MSVRASNGSPFEHSVDARPAGMDLKRVGEHDEDDNGGFADSGADGGCVYQRIVSTAILVVGAGVGSVHRATMLPPTELPKDR